MKLKTLLVSSCSLCLLATTAPVFATAGYFALSYGPKSSSMAGAVVAAPQDATIASVNPAGMGLVGERVDLSLMLFSPIREASLGSSNTKSSREFFVIPNGGFSYKINDKLTGGVSLYSNGGMNTTYSSNLYDEATASILSGGQSKKTGLPDTGELSIDLAQMILAPTLSYQITPNHSFGISALLAVQFFKAKGLGGFQCFTRTGATQNGNACTPGNAGPATPGFKASSDLSNNPYDFSYGAGVRLGWVGKVHPMVTLGLAGSSPIYMTEFHKYSELFAEHGGFDIPANITAGIALNPVPEVLVSFDYQRIFYGSVNSIANKGPIATPQGPGFPEGTSFLGDNNGLGFGWNDINVYRIGLQYQYNPEWTFSAGYSWNDRPFEKSQVLFNIVSPATITKHITFGISYSPSKDSELNLSYQHAFKESISGQTALGPSSLSMYQNSIEIGYSWKF